MNLIKPKHFLISVILGISGFLLVYNEIYFVLPGTNLLTDMREIFVTIAAALLGPVGGAITAILACLYDPNPELLPYIIAQHIVTALLLSFYYKKFVYEKLTMPLLVAGWTFGIFLYYFVFYLPVFITVYFFDPAFFNQIVPGNKGLWDVMEVLYLYTGWAPEFVFTTVFTSLIIIALPEQYRKPIWGKASKSSQLKPKNFGIKSFDRLRLKNSLAVRLTIWFILLAIFPILVIGVSIKKDVTHTLLINEAIMREDLVKDIIRVSSKFNGLQVTDLLKRVKQNVKGDVFFIDTQGRYAFTSDSSKSGSKASNDYSSAIVVKILAEKNGKLTDIDNERSLAYGSIKIQNNDLILVTVSNQLKIKALLEGLNTEINQKLFIGILIISFGLIGTIWLIIQLPLNEVRKTIEKITDGDFDFRVNTENLIDEIQSLGSALNTMANKITSSEKKYREMADLLPQTLFETDSKGKLTYANQNGFSLFGYTLEDFENGINIIDFVSPADQPKALQNVKRIIQGENLRGNEYKAIKKDGTVFPSIIYSSAFDENGIVHGIRGILIDLTNIKQAEESIKASEEKFKSIVQGLTDMIFIVNAEGKINFMTPSVSRITGYTEDEMMNKSPIEFIHPDDVELANSELSQGEKSNYDSTPTLYRIKQKTGSYIYAETIGIDMQDNKFVKGIVVFCRNVTERIKYEKKLSQSETKLKESQRVAKLGHYDFYIQTGKWAASEALNSLFGVDENYIHDLDGWKNLIYSEDREETLKYLQENVIKGKNKFEREYRIVRFSDKKIIWVYGLGNLEFNQNNQAVLMFGTIQDITERKIAQNILYNSEQRFKYVWENTLDAMRLTDEKGTVLLVNEAYCNLTGKKREYLEGHNFTVVLPEEKQYEAKIKYLENFRNKILDHRFEHSLKFWNKKVIHANIVHAFLRIPEQPILLLTVFHDITDRKVTEDYLKESEEKFRQAFDYSASGVVILDLDGKFQKVNSSFANMMGYTENELKKLSFNDITYSEDVNPSNAVLNELLQGNINYSSFEKRYLAKNNKVIWAYISTSLVRDTNNKPQFFISQIIDLTERKNAEESVTKLSMAVEQSPAIIMITNTAGNIEYVNKKFTETTGYLLEEVIGANPRILKSGHTSGEEYSGLWRTITSGNEWRGEFLNKKKDGTLYWEYAFISPIVSEGGVIKNYLAVKEDITERKKLLADLIETKQKAEEMNKIKSYFFANMSHELRTPFVGIMGFSELLSESLQNPEERNMAEQILKSSKRLTETLNKILNVTRIEFDNLEINLKHFNVCRLIKDISLLYSSSAQLKNTILSTICDNEDMIIYSDPKVLEDILNNLVSNAIKFTENGFIYLKASRIKENDSEILLLTVEDTGIGIPFDKQEIVWQEFRQASEGFNRSFEGTGLGLTISRKYVKLLGGDISLQSEEGKGTIFTIRLPFKDAEIDQVNGKEESIELSKPGPHKKTGIGSKVLFVEDDATALQYINIVLKSLCEIDTAIDATSAIKLIEKKKYDILMLDINLGKGMDGVELMQRIRKNPDYKNIPIVAITAYASENDKKEFLEKGFSHYLSKPFTSIELKRLLNDLFI